MQNRRKKKRFNIPFFNKKRHHKHISDSSSDDDDESLSESSDSHEILHRPHSSYYKNTGTKSGSKPKTGSKPGPTQVVHQTKEPDIMMECDRDLRQLKEDVSNQVYSWLFC